MDPIKRFEAGGVKQFLVTYSASPNSTPLFTIFTGSVNQTVVTTVFGTVSTSTTVASTQFYAYWTCPTSRLFYTATWVACYTGIGPVVNRDFFQVIFTSG